MCVCFVSVKVTLKCVGSFFPFLCVKAKGLKVVQREESFKIFCRHCPLLLPQSISVFFYILKVNRENGC